MLTPEMLSLLSELLRSTQTPPGLPEESARALQLKGAVLALQQEGSSEAVALLETAITACPEGEIRDSAFLALADLAVHGSAAAHEAVFNLEIDHNHPLAPDLIHNLRIESTNPTRMAVHHLLNRQADLLAACDPDLELVSAFFLQAKIDLQQRLLKAASPGSLQHWAVIMIAINEPVETRLKTLLDAYGSFQELFRRIARRELTKLANLGNPAAQDLICRLYLRYDDQLARQIALEAGYQPSDQVEQTLFFFFTEQWRAIEQLDFDHTLINIAFETAPAEMRRRIMAHSRYTGQSDWLKAPTGRLRTRLITDLTDADWQNAIQNLWSQDKKNDLWHLAQIAPPRWGADLLVKLSGAGWRPADPEEVIAFQGLVDLAARCANLSPEIQPRQQMQVMLADITCLAYHPESQQLALGSSESALALLAPPGYEGRFKPLTTPAAQIRALGFSPDGQYLACAGGDHRIRVFQIQGYKMIKTLEGHSGMIRSLQFSSDGRVLYSAGFDGSIRAWRFPQGPELYTLARQEAEIFGLVVAYRGKYLLSAGTDATVTVRSLPAGDILQKLPTQPNSLTLLSAADGELVATFCRDQVIRLWNFVSSKILITIPTGQNISALCLSADERAILAGYPDGSIAIWDTSTGARLAYLKGHARQVIGLALSRDDSRLFSASADSRLCLWNNTVISLLQRPTGILGRNTIDEIETRYRHEKMSDTERAWLNFTTALARFRTRFDIEVAEATILPAGEFDIQL